MSWGAVAKALADAKERQEAFQRGDYTKKRAWPLIVKSGESAEVSFIDHEPWAGFVHTLPKVDGRGFETFLCKGKGKCSHCKTDKAKFRAFFTVVDHRSRTFTNKDGEEQTVANQLRYYECSAGTADMLLKLLTKKKKDLSDVVVDISKFGSGTATTTTFDFLDREAHHELPEDAESINFPELFGGEAEASSGPRYD